jgi:hypothetical protein
MSKPHERHRVVVVGGGFGGLQVVRGLRRAPVEVTLIDRRNFHLFQPLLDQVATGALSPDEIAAPLRATLNRQRNVRVVMVEVRRFDLDHRRVVIDALPNGDQGVVIPPALPARGRQLVIDPRAPFRLDLTAWALRRRAHNAIDRWDGRVYRRGLSLGDEALALSVTQSGPRDAPHLAVTLYGGQLDQRAEAAARGSLDKLLGLKVDLSGSRRWPPRTRSSTSLRAACVGSSRHASPPSSRRSSTASPANKGTLIAQSHGSALGTGTGTCRRRAPQSTAQTARSHSQWLSGCSCERPNRVATRRRPRG